MPNAIDAVIANATNTVTPNGSEQPVAPANNTNVVPMRRGGEVASGGYTTGPVAGMGVDPAAFSRTPATTTPTEPQPPPPQVIVVQQPEKPGFFKRLGKALNPMTWAKKVAAKSKKLARAIGWGGTAAAGAGAVATTALAANHFAPVAVHGVLKGLGLLGLLGPQSAALGAAAVAGTLTIGAIAGARAFLKAGKKVEPKKDVQQPKEPEPAKKEEDGESKKPSLFRRITAGVLNTVGIGGGLAVGGYGLFQAGAAVLGGAAVTAALPMLALPAAAIFGGGMLVAAAKAIKGGGGDE